MLLLFFRFGVASAAAVAVVVAPFTVVSLLKCYYYY